MRPIENSFEIKIEIFQIDRTIEHLDYVEQYHVLNFRLNLSLHRQVDIFSPKV